MDDKYQPVGTAVMTANGLLLVKYPYGIPESYPENDYKNLLREDYKPMYEHLQPYRVKIQKVDGNFIARVYDGNLIILTDWSCTEGRIDCWSYNKECNPDTLHVLCAQ
jgi:hypothetical protein